MNIFHKVALRGHIKNRTRTIVTIIGIILSAGLITAAVTFGFSLMDYAAAGASVKYGSWHVEFMDVDSAFVQERSSDPEAKSELITGNIGYARLQDGKNPDKPYLYITSFGQDAFEALPQTLLSGRLPENSGEVMIPSHLQSNGGVELAVGDTISLTVGNLSLIHIYPAGCKISILHCDVYAVHYRIYIPVCSNKISTELSD